MRRIPAHLVELCSTLVLDLVPATDLHEKQSFVELVIYLSARHRPPREIMGVIKAILVAQLLSALVFLIMGAMFAAPYWLYDGASFLVTFILGFLAIRSFNALQALPSSKIPSSSSSSSSSSPHVAYSRACVLISAASILIEIGFIVFAVVLWNREMNPIAVSSYGRDGSSFFFCSLYSSICNVFVVAYYYRLSRTTGPALPPMHAMSEAT